MVLRKNRPARVAGARVMAGNIRVITPASRRRGAPPARRADIWVKDPLRRWKTFSVRAGQLFDIAGGRIAVVAIERDAVELLLEERPH